MDTLPDFNPTYYIKLSQCQCSPRYHATAVAGWQIARCVACLRLQPCHAEKPFLSRHFIPPEAQCLSCPRALVEDIWIPTGTDCVQSLCRQQDVLRTCHGSEVQDARRVLSQRLRRASEGNRQSKVCLFVAFTPSVELSIAQGAGNA